MRARAENPVRAGAIGAIVRNAILVMASLSLWSGTAIRSAGAEEFLKLQPASALFSVETNTVVTVGASWVFWRGNWDWIGASVRAEPTGEPGDLAHDLASAPGSGVHIQGEVRKTAPRTLTWEFDVRKEMAPDAYGGLSFTLKTAGGRAPQQDEVRIFADASGWEFSPSRDRQPVRVTFDPAPKELVFENESLNEIRAYFLTKTGGDAKIRMTVAVPDGVLVDRMDARLRSPDATWRPSVMLPRHAPIDLSFLNARDRPAGKRGFVRAVGDALEFEDGTPARFWGTNITAYGLFHTPDNAVVHHAKRLAKLGFNLVRFTHHDSDWVEFNIFGLQRDYTGELNDIAFEKLDWWIKCLKDEGIYVWLDLHVGRKFGRDEGIADFEEIGAGEARAEIRGFNYVNRDIQRLMQKFNKDYLTHVNKYTQIAYGQDPAIIAYLLTNENDINMHFGGVVVPSAGAPRHSARYMQAAQSFAGKTGLDPDVVWRFWEPGPAKLFASDLERDSYQAATDDLRAFWARAMVVPSNYWGGMSLSGLLSLTQGDVVDTHAYAKPGEIAYDPRFRPGMIAWLASGAVAGKPATTTEWNVEPFPAYDRAGLSAHVGAIAAMQEWSAVMQYAYATAGLGRTEGPGNYSASSDPAFIASLPIAALLYRRGDVRPAEKTYVLDLSPEQVTSTLSPENSRALRTIAETSKLRIGLPAIEALPWLKPTETPDGAIEITDPQFDAIPAEQTDRVCSDTGEICRNWKSGILTIDTARSQYASGWIGGNAVTLRNVEMAITTPYAVMAVQSLDDLHIGRSRKILLTAMAQSVPSGGNKLPYLSEPVEGKVEIETNPGLKAYALSSDGSRREIPAVYENGAYKLTLKEDLAGFWILLSE